MALHLTNYRALRNAYAPDQAEVQQVDGKLTITLWDATLYPDGGYRLSDRSEALLAKLVPFVTGLQRTKVEVGCYTDSAPTAPELESQALASSLELSSKRAEGMIAFLRKQGVLKI